MKLQKRVLFWVATLVVLVAIFATPVVALASTPRVNSNAAIYPMVPFSPSLGDASSFTVLAYSLISDVGASSHINGNVGLSPTTGAAIGLLCTQVTGIIYEVDAGGPLCFVTNPVLLTNAQLANNAAFGQLSAGANAACTTYPGPSQDLVGLTLVPGVYCANAFTLSGTLILDDTGAPNGVWIFRSASTLTTSVGAKVQFLTGVGSPCNVWWGTVSSATIGGGNTFIGNILSQVSIDLGIGTALDGRALAYTGAVTMKGGNSVTLCTTPAPAPPPPPPSTGLSIFKFNDLNGNGVYELALGESPLAGRQVTITGPFSYNISTSTNWAGLIVLTSLVPGTYIVTETVLPGWTIPNNPQTVTVLANNMTPVKFADKPQLGPTVGGTVMPVDKGGLLIPWLGMAVLLLLATGAVLFIRRRNSR
ncbi:MAG: ice-binding family protein [Dehalococcoidia bacterium]|jgi:hypothetical protein